MFGIRSNFIASPFSARYEFVVPKEPEPVEEIIGFGEEPDPHMQEKKQIVEAREKKLKNKKTKNKGLPGQKLLKRLAKQQQVEDSLMRVVKHLNS
jgi:hypothetical protein